MIRLGLVLFFLILFTTGCAALLDTLDDVAGNPEELITEAGKIGTAVDTNLPKIPTVASIAIGYIIAFARTWYKNAQKKIAQANLKA